MTTYDLGKVVGDKGDDGEDGVGIASISKTGSSGLVDTYTITYTNGDTDTFTVTNGSDASVTIQTSWGSTTSDSKVPSEKLVKSSLDNKLDKSQTSYKGKNVVVDSTSGLITFENKPTIPTKVSDITNDSGFITSSSLPTKTSDLTNDGDGTNAFLTQHQSLANYVQKSSTSGLLKNDGTVDTTSYSTFSGSYSDLSNKPTIPSSSSDLSDGSDLVKTSSTTGLLKNDGGVMQSGTGASNWAVGNHTHSGYVSATKVTSWQSTPSDSNVPSEKLVKDYVDGLIGSAISYIVGSGS